VLSFNAEKGFGFVNAGLAEDVFVHIKDCVDGAQPAPGDVLRFRLEPSQGKPGQMQAKSVTGGSSAKPQFGVPLGDGQPPPPAPIPGHHSGRVKSFNNVFGFIDAGLGSDVFLHIKDCIDGAQPAQGDLLSFELEPSQSKPGQMQAKRVTGGSVVKPQICQPNAAIQANEVPGTGAYLGTVKSFNEVKGFGFIESPGCADIFLHAKDCVGSQARQGDNVRFDVEPSRNRPGQMVAKQVTGGSAPLGESQGGSMAGYGPVRSSAGGVDLAGYNPYGAAGAAGMGQAAPGTGSMAGGYPGMAEMGGAASTPGAPGMPAMGGMDMNALIAQLYGGSFPGMPAASAPQ
jgi:cold shock CspA family protein